VSQNKSNAVMQETWRPVAGWPGYEVSDRGRVRSWKQRAPGRVWAEDRSQEPHILRPDTRNGYLSVVLSDKALGRQWAAIHRLVLEAFVGPAPEGAQGAHGDGDRNNNTLRNLSWKTPVANNADKRLHGTHQHGELIGTAKLTFWQVAQIRRLRAAGEPCAAVAAAFGVCRNTVTNITTNRAWRG